MIKTPPACSCGTLATIIKINLQMNYRFRIILVFFISILLSEKILGQSTKNKVLLIDYYEDRNLKVLKDYKDPNKMFKYIPGLPIPNPIFNMQTKRLNVEGVFNVTDSSKIIFLGHGEAKEISLPFRFSKLKLEKLLNDSTIIYNLNDRKYTTTSGQEVTDTIVSKETNGERVIQYTTIYYLTNYGLINKDNIFDYKDRENELQYINKNRESKKKNE